MASLIAESQGELSTFLLSEKRFLVLTDVLDWSNLYVMDLSNLDSFRKQINEAQTALSGLYSFRRFIDTKIGDLSELIRANANFLPDAERESELLSVEMLRTPATIAEAIKIVLFLARARAERLTTVQIKERAEQRGFDFTGYTNPMASIHTILKRMKDSDPPEVDFNEETGTYYGGGSPFPADLADPEFFNRLSEEAWARIREENSIWADKIAGETIEKFLNQIKTRPERQYKKK